MKKIDRKIFLRIRANKKVIIECRDIYVPPEKRMYNYYVKDTTLRTRYNMIPKDFFNSKKVWVGCDTRNQAKRLIAKNREIIKIQKIIDCVKECFIQAVNSVEIGNFKTSKDNKEEREQKNENKIY